MLDLIKRFNEKRIKKKLEFMEKKGYLDNSAIPIKKKIPKRIKDEDGYLIIKVENTEDVLNNKESVDDFK
ncbi:hypothetical protein ACFL1H_03145 [Nanoarchaeota archaeon]